MLILAVYYHFSHLKGQRNEIPVAHLSNLSLFTMLWASHSMRPLLTADEAHFVSRLVSLWGLWEYVVSFEVCEGLLIPPFPFIYEGKLKSHSVFWKETASLLSGRPLLTRAPEPRAHALSGGGP